MSQAVVIQRCARGFLARRHAARLRKARDELNSFLAEQAEKDTQRSAARRKREIERRMRPRTTEDFEVLYNELEAWRLQETRTIEAADLPPQQRKDAMQALLHKARRPHAHLHQRLHQRIAAAGASPPRAVEDRWPCL